MEISSCEESRSRPGPEAGPLSRRPALPALLLSLLLAACGGGGSPASPGPAPTSNPGPASTSNPGPASTSNSGPVDWGNWAAKWNQSPHYQFLYTPGSGGGDRRYSVDPEAASGSTCCLERGDAPRSGTATFNHGNAVGLVKDEGGAYDGYSAHAAVEVRVNWAANLTDATMKATFFPFELYATPDGAVVHTVPGREFTDVPLTSGVAGDTNVYFDTLGAAGDQVTAWLLEADSNNVFQAVMGNFQISTISGVFGVWR